MNGSDTKDDEMNLELLGTIEERSDLSQRDLTSRLGAALGLTNSYLRWCARKGYQGQGSTGKPPSVLSHVPGVRGRILLDGPVPVDLLGVLPPGDGIVQYPVSRLRGQGLAPDRALRGLRSGGDSASPIGGP